jgi:hypothetical protein
MGLAINSEQCSKIEVGVCAHACVHAHMQAGMHIYHIYGDILNSSFGIGCEGLRVYHDVSKWNTKQSWICDVTSQIDYVTICDCKRKFKQEHFCHALCKKHILSLRVTSVSQRNQMNFPVCNPPSTTKVLIVLTDKIFFKFWKIDNICEMTTPNYHVCKSS